MSGILRTFALGLATGLVLWPHPARASQFTVNPTRIELSGRVTSGVVTVRNDGQSPVRVQVKTHVWTQTLDGQMTLGPTEDVIVFPTLLTLAPGEERRLRIAVTAPPIDVERTYRVFLEELPPVKAAEVKDTGVQVLTRVGIPVFVQATSPAAKGGLSQVGLVKGALQFQIDNLGNTHFVPDSIRVRSLTASGDTVSDQSTEGWYILSRSSRRYEMTLPVADCARLRSVVIDVRVGGASLKSRLETPTGACAQ